MIGREPFEESSWSGSSKYFFEQCRKAGLLERAVGVEVPQYHRIPLILRNFSPHREIWKWKFYLDTEYYRALTKTIWRRLGPGDFRCDILQIGGIYNLPQYVKGRCACYSYHDGNLAQAVRSPYWPQTLPRKTIDRALRFEQDVYRGLDKIFTMSEYLRKSFIEDFRVPEDKVITIGAGINWDTIPEVSEKDYDQKNILFIGVDFRRKGGMVLLQAFQKVRAVFPKAQLHIVGPCHLKIGAEMAKGVVLHGFLSKGSPQGKRILDRLFHQCSLLVMPSLYEPFGIAPLEGMAHEVPCVLTQGWAFPEMVRPGVNGELVERGNVEELADKITNLLGNPNLLQTMGKAGRNVVLEKYTWHSVVSRLEKELQTAPNNVSN